MQKHKDIFGQVGRLAVALLVCVAVMLAIYGLLGAFSQKVCWARCLAFCSPWATLFR